MLGDGRPLMGADAMNALCTSQVEGLDVGTWRNERASVSNAFDPFPGALKAWTLGFVSNLEPGPNGRARGSLAWAGLSNCYYWIDRASGAAGVMCAQFLPFADARALDAFAAFERAVYEG
jgi:methyl acetate hydrolase